jgi:hypothetical protein
MEQEKAARLYCELRRKSVAVGIGRVPIATEAKLFYSVPDPLDPRVFGPPGSGSNSQRYGSGSFYH